MDGRHLREPVPACVSSLLHRLTDGAMTEHAPWYRGGSPEHCASIDVTKQESGFLFFLIDQSAIILSVLIIYWRARLKAF